MFLVDFSVVRSASSSTLATVYVIQTSPVVPWLPRFATLAHLDVNTCKKVEVSVKNQSESHDSEGSLVVIDSLGLPHSGPQLWKRYLVVRA
jgi:hypothetical protein